jgi:predicted dehydrogenase
MRVRSGSAWRRRCDEAGELYEVDVENRAFAIFELEDGILAHIASSWASRVKRDDLLQIQVDGGLHRCFIQPLVSTPSGRGMRQQPGDAPWAIEHPPPLIPSQHNSLHGGGAHGVSRRVWPTLLNSHTLASIALSCVTTSSVIPVACSVVSAARLLGPRAALSADLV